MPRPQTVTAAGVLLLVVGANVALGGAALAVILFRSPASPCLCLACPFSAAVLAAGLGCLRLGWLVLKGRFDDFRSIASVGAGVGALVAFLAGALLANELPRIVRAARAPTFQDVLGVGALALVFCDGVALVVAGFLLAAARHRYADWRSRHASPLDSGGDPLPGRSPRP